MRKSLSRRREGAAVVASKVSWHSPVFVFLRRRNVFQLTVTEFASCPFGCRAVQKVIQFGAFVFVVTLTRRTECLIRALPGVFGYLGSPENVVRASLVQLVEVARDGVSGLPFFPRGDEDRERRRRGECERERER